MIRIVVADDHSSFVDCLAIAFETTDIDLVGVADNGLEAISKVVALRPQAALLDANMPQMNGLDAAREIFHSAPTCKVILLSVRSDEGFIAEAIRAGVCGYIHKSEPFSRILEAIRKVTNGQMYLSDMLLGPLLQRHLSGGDEDPLSTRERQVLQLVSEGYTTKDIGAMLSISPKTAESHRARIMAKLNLHDVASLVRYALRRGLTAI